ncbi:hypothetical protein FS842_002194 [Serendipita sp. 407]|nr:hypothetical protein FS842_002194 [Serendipita sp. 407]
MASYRSKLRSNSSTRGSISLVLVETLCQPYGISSYQYTHRLISRREGGITLEEANHCYDYIEFCDFLSRMALRAVCRDSHNSPPTAHWPTIRKDLNSLTERDIPHGALFEAYITGGTSPLDLTSTRPTLSR